MPLGRHRAEIGERSPAVEAMDRPRGIDVAAYSFPTKLADWVVLDPQGQSERPRTQGSRASYQKVEEVALAGAQSCWATVLAADKTSLSSFGSARRQISATGCTVVCVSTGRSHPDVGRASCERCRSARYAKASCPGISSRLLLRTCDINLLRGLGGFSLRRAL
jgi:DNA-binding transcriptional regulator YdaS (Cro superfamily)